MIFFGLKFRKEYKDMTIYYSYMTEAPAQARSEYFKRYRETHREHLAALEHARWERKKEELKEIRNAKHACEMCGGRFTYSNKSFHEKSKKHQAALATSEPG